MKIKFLLAAFGIMIGTAAFAQEDKLVVKPSGRLLFDGALMNSSNDEVNEQTQGGLSIPDVRLGAKAKYGKWEAKFDIGYARQSLSLKDVFIQYNFDKKNFLRGGYFVHQFGYQSATSSSFKVSMEEPETHSLLGSGSRLLGVMFVHEADKFHGAFSLYSDNASMKNNTRTGYQGNGAMTRLLYVPFTERGKIFQFGVGGAYDHKRKDRALTWSSNYPDRVSSTTAIGADGAKLGLDYSFKVTSELALAKKWFGLEAQYIFMTAHRDKDAQVNQNAATAYRTATGNELKLKNYKAWGAYANARFLLNSEYSYVSGDAGIATPDPKSWEIVAAYNYSDMNSGNRSEDGGYNYYNGGRLCDYSLTMNYYINKYFLWRVSAHYVHSGESEYTGFGKNDYKVLETRLQIKF